MGPFEYEFHIGNNKLGHTVGEVAGEPDANLIAAAPELLFACEVALDKINGVLTRPVVIKDVLEKAIAKAKGLKP